MKIISTELKDCFILEPTIFKDLRGYFFESFNEKLFKKQSGLDVNFIQDNESFSSKGVLRGLHFQRGEHAQAKLVRVIIGKVLDVVLDIRENSQTFGKHISVLLTEENKRQLFVPRGFAHGFIVLSETAIFSYKCDNYYNKESEGGIIYNDPKLGIDWQLPAEELIVSKKDMTLPQLDSFKL